MSAISTASPLLTTLAKLTHLDLTGRVCYDNSSLKAHGGYCDVFVGECSLPTNHGAKVAVKRLRIHAQGSHDFAKQLAKEMNLWSKLVHRNILTMWGFVLEGDYPCLVSEWMENGTVTQYVASRSDCDVIYMLVGIASGLAYLHAYDVVHSDIKADNVLVSQAGEPLICDFGISRRLSATHTVLGGTTTGVKGSIRWMSPEVLDVTSSETAPIHTKASDVWAFGMVVYELLARRLPYDHLKLDVHVLFAIIQGQLPSRPLISRSPRLARVWSLCLPQKACWDKDAEQRPPMTHVLFYLERCLSLTGNDYEQANLADFASEPWVTRGLLPAAPESLPVYSSFENNEDTRRQHNAEAGVNESTRSLPTRPVDETEDKQFIDGQEVRFFVRALYDYSATTDEEFDFLANDLIAVTSTPADGWWRGGLIDKTRRDPRKNTFPSNFVQIETGFYALGSNDHGIQAVGSADVTPPWANAGQVSSLVPNQRVLFYVRALYDYDAESDRDISFQANDILAVTSTPSDGWWIGMLAEESRREIGRIFLPCNFVALF